MSTDPRDNPYVVRTVPAAVIHVGLSLALLRALSSYSWLTGALLGKDAKFSSDFLSGTGLIERIVDPQKGFAHTAVSPGIASFLTNTVVPHASFFAWTIAVSELLIGISLLFGLFSRLGGLAAIARATTNVLVAGASPETLGHNYMLALAGLVVVSSAAGRAYGIDRVLIQNFPESRILRLLG